MKILEPHHFPKNLQNIPNPPQKLYLQGVLPDPETYIYLCVIGSRRHSSYGKDVCRELIAGLAGYPIVIVSGLALGIDAIAHQSAIESGLLTIAFPGSGLDESILYPAQHLQLAREIIYHGGAIISEFSPKTESAHWTFPQRNRLMAGISQAVLIIEGRERSGTQITATYAADYGRDVMAVPGSIFSPQSGGTHQLIKQGATPVTSSNDILEALGFHLQEKQPELFDTSLSDYEQKILNICSQKTTLSDLARKLDTPISGIMATISDLEIRGYVRESEGFVYRVK
jgi:DNA processing protein